MAKSFKFIDLFCGCGGLSHGLEMAGHKCLLGIDKDAAAIETFLLNHPHATSYTGDIKKLTNKKIKELISNKTIDMVVGGPPCQGFSTVGKGSSDDERNSLFKEFVRIVKLTKPKVIIFENVTGILAKKNGKVLQEIFKNFEKIGYQMDARVMSADDYQVSSRRRRTIIMGTLGTKPIYPEVTGCKPLTIAKLFKTFKTKDGQVYNHDIKGAQIKNELDAKRLEKIPAGRGIRYEKDELEFLPKRLRFGINWKEISENRFRQTRLQRIPWNDVAPTILTSRSMYYHPKETRYLTVREAAACQSFPNDFIFKGSTTAQFRQIGNAVPPMLAYYLGESIKKIKFGKTKKSQAVLERSVISNAFNYKAAKRV